MLLNAKIGKAFLFQHDCKRGSVIIGFLDTHTVHIQFLKMVETSLKPPKYEQSRRGWT